MAIIFTTIAVALTVAALVKLVMNYWSDLNFSKEFNGAGVPLPLFGHCYFLFKYDRIIPRLVNPEDGLDLLSELSKSDPAGRKLACSKIYFCLYHKKLGAPLKLDIGGVFLFPLIFFSVKTNLKKNRTKF